MPSASSVKVDKTVDSTMDPFKQSLKFVEHKIRNLEKRKGKLDVYKKDQQDGKELNTDQLAAVAKFTEVVQQLDFSRDFLKQLTQLNDENDKSLKKQMRQQKAEQIERLLEQQKNYENLLIFQGILKKMAQGKGREILLDSNASNHQFTDDDIKSLEEFKNLVDPGSPTSPDFFTNAEGAGEKYSQLFEGSSKVAVNGRTFSEIRTMLLAIRKSNYLNSLLTIENDNAVKEASPPKEVVETQPPKSLPSPSGQPMSRTHASAQGKPRPELPFIGNPYRERPKIKPDNDLGTSPKIQKLTMDRDGKVISNLVMNVGHYKFLQDSRIDVTPHMDPAVVAVSSVAPMMPPKPMGDQPTIDANGLMAKLKKAESTTRAAKTKKKEIEQWKPEGQQQQWIPPKRQGNNKPTKWGIDPNDTEEWGYPNQNEPKPEVVNDEWRYSKDTGSEQHQQHPEIAEWVCPPETVGKPTQEMEEWVCPKEVAEIPNGIKEQIQEDLGKIEVEDWATACPGSPPAEVTAFPPSNLPPEKDTQVEDEWTTAWQGNEGEATADNTWNSGVKEDNEDKKQDEWFGKGNSQDWGAGQQKNRVEEGYNKRRPKTSSRSRGGRGSHNGYGRDHPREQNRDQNRDYNRDYGRGDFNRDYNRDHNNVHSRPGYSNGRGGGFHGQGDPNYNADTHDAPRGNGHYRGGFRGAQMTGDQSFSRGGEFRRGRGSNYRGF